MVAAPALTDLSTLDADALRSLLLDRHQKLLSNNNEIEHLQPVIARLRRMLLGAKSERGLYQEKQKDVGYDFVHRTGRRMGSGQNEGL
jgi:hypothetical protein